MIVPASISCPACPAVIEVSEEDPDASLSDLRARLGRHAWEHGERNRLFIRAQENAS